MFTNIRWIILKNVLRKLIFHKYSLERTVCFREPRFIHFACCIAIIADGHGGILPTWVRDRLCFYLISYTILFHVQKVGLFILKRVESAYMSSYGVTSLKHGDSDSLFSNLVTSVSEIKTESHDSVEMDNSFHTFEDIHGVLLIWCMFRNAYKRIDVDFILFYQNLRILLHLQIQR